MAFKTDLRLLKERHQLIKFLEIEELVFEEVIAFDVNAGLNVNLPPTIITTIEIPHFVRHKIPKKNIDRGFRTVWEVTHLKNNYKALARRLRGFFEMQIDGFPHHRAFGFTLGRNIKENAKDHCGHKNLMSVDIKDFFPSISSDRIEKFFMSIGLTPSVATALSRFVTIDGSLPLGLATSPIIANALCFPLDVELTQLAKMHGVTYSRYADDMTFSSNGEIPKIEIVRDCIENNQFQLAASKTKISKSGQAHYITGLSVSDVTHPHVPRGKKRYLRQQLYYCEKYGIHDHLNQVGLAGFESLQMVINHLDGMVKYVAFHEPRLAQQLKSSWVNILKRGGCSPSFEPKNQHRTPFQFYIDEAEFMRPDGVRILALSISVSQHQSTINEATKALLEATKSDVWAPGNKEAIVRNGLHFSDATEDLRRDYIEVLGMQPFEGFVAMVGLSDSADYEAKYLSLLNALIKRRLMASESKAAHLFFEKNNKVREDLVRDCVGTVYDNLQKTNNRRPLGYFVGFVGKPNLGMSVPDFLLGVLGKYLKAGQDIDDKPISRDKLLFERIRDKYRVIIDLEDNVEYSRRNPITPWKLGHGITTTES